MRKLMVAVSAVALVALGASVAQAQGTQKCPKPEEIKFEQPFQVGETQNGISVTSASGDSTVTFSIAQGTVVTQICVKAGNTAPVFSDFEADGSMTIGGITINYSCTFPGAITDNTGDGNNDLVGPCTVTVNRGGPGLGLSHVTFYTEDYVAPEAAVAPLVAAQGAGAVGVAGAAGGGLAFTGAQISIMLVILAGLIAVGTLAWTAGRRRAAKAE